MNKQKSVMEGIRKEAEEVMNECEEGAMCDSGIISAAKRVQYYEVDSYGTLIQFAETLGLHDAVKYLQTRQDEGNAANDRFTEIAMNTVNLEAVSEEA